MENQMLDFDPQAVGSTYFLDIHPVSSGFHSPYFMNLFQVLYALIRI